MLLILLLHVDAVAGGDVECAPKKFIWKKNYVAYFMECSIAFKLFRLVERKSFISVIIGKNADLLEFFSFQHSLIFLVNSIQNIYSI